MGDAQANLNENCAYLAHDVVRFVIEQVQNLERDFNDDIENRRDFEHIYTLINIIGCTGANLDPDTVQKIFRYLAAAKLFTAIIISSFQNEQNSLHIPTSASAINLSSLNEVALDILNEMNRYTFQNDENENRFAGMRSGIVSKGSIPFMRVYSGHNHEVFIRRGIELSGLRNNAKIVANHRDPLDTYPIQVTKNGKKITSNIAKNTLVQLIPHDKFRKRVMQNKYITWIQVTVRDMQIKKTVYEIDVMDHYIRRDADTASIPEDLLIKISGVNKQQENAQKDEHFSEEDIIISFFSHILFKSEESKWCCQRLETEGGLCEAYSRCDSCEKAKNMEEWSHKIIKKILTNESGNEIYLGFCFRSLFDAGYSDKKVVNSSTAVLLIALTRGFLKLRSNLNSSYLILSNDVIEYRNQCNRRSLFNRLGFWDFQWLERNKDKRMEEERQSKMEIKSGRVERNEYRRHTKFIAANSKGITVRTRFPVTLLIILLFDLCLILSYGIVLGIRQTRLAQKNWEEYLAGLTTVITAAVGVSLLILKLCFRSWEIVDMCHRRRRATSMSELHQVMDKHEIIKVFAQLTNPGDVFSSYRSSSFTMHGKGEFEIDEHISVRDLQDAGFLFGVDYYGFPIVADGIGRIRKVKFPNVNSDAAHRTAILDSIRNEKEHREDEKVKYELTEQALLHIEGAHDLDISFIYKTPIANMYSDSLNTFESV